MKLDLNVTLADASARADLSTAERRRKREHAAHDYGRADADAALVYDFYEHPEASHACAAAAQRRSGCGRSGRGAASQFGQTPSDNRRVIRAAAQLDWPQVARFKIAGLSGRPLASQTFLFLREAAQTLLSLRRTARLPSTSRA